MVVRELIALLGIQTDKKSENEAKSGMESLIKYAKAAVAAFAAFQVGAWFKDIAKQSIELASDAQETLNVIDAAFKQNQNAVIDWASAYSEEVGRSEFQMREMAATLGAVLSPMMEGNADAAAAMSTRLAELTVDLGSFYNAAEPDVLIALRSGITGEAEPLKRFGIVMKEATLENFRMTQGITKSYKAMTEAEKTALRYNFIIETTANAHGDAAKTAGGWANATKALSAKIFDIKTIIGLEMLPMMENLLATFLGWIKEAGGVGVIARRLVPIFKSVARVFTSVVKALGSGFMWVVKLVKNMSPLEKAVLKIGTAVTIVGALITAGPIGKLLLLGTLIALIIDDFMVWREGGKSVIGDLVAAFNDLLGIDIVAWVQKGIDYFATYLNALQEYAIAMVSTIMSLVEFLINVWDDPKAAFEKLLQDLLWIWTDAWNAIKEHINLVLGWFGTSLDDLYQKVVSWVSDVVDAIAGPFKKVGKIIADVFGSTPDVEAEVTTGSPEIKGIKTLFEPKMNAGGGLGPQTMGPGIGMGRSVVNAPKTNVEVSVNASPGMNEKNLAGEVARQVESAIQRQNRAAIQALTPAKETGPL